MAISLPEQTLALTKENSPFNWDPRALKYLGVWLKSLFTSTYEQNFPHLIKSIEDLKLWYSGYFSWFNRAAIFKMTILPIALPYAHVTHQSLHKLFLTHWDLSF